MLKVDKIFVISVNSDICVGSPSSLDFLSGQSVFCFQLNLLLSFQVSSPGPLDLDCGDVIHSEPVVFEEPSSQRHFVSCLNNSGTEISQALILILVHHVSDGR